MLAQTQVQRSACQNCDWQGPDHELQPIKDFLQRVQPGEPTPSGECPECGSLCQPLPMERGR